VSGWSTQTFFHLDGGLVGQRHCGFSTSCSHETTTPSACPPTGTHTASAICLCGHFVPGPGGEPKIEAEEAGSATCCC